MSRIGKSPIPVPKGVEVQVDGRVVRVKGPKGALEQEVKEGISAQVEEDQVLVSIDEGTKNMSPFQGLYRSLIANMVTGVTEGFKKQLEMQGVGFRAAVKGNLLDLQVGYSHPVELPIPEGIEVGVEKNTLITVSGANKQAVGQFAADIRMKRKPEPYKGKGIRYVGEYVRRKAGKSAK